MTATLSEQKTLLVHQATAPHPAAPRTRLGGFGQALRRLAWFMLAVALVLALLAFYWSREPHGFDVASQTAAYHPPGQTAVSGLATTAAVIGVAETLLDKPGGYLRNDVAPPSSLLDNMPNWEYGVLIELRDTVRALRDDFGRAQSQSMEDPDLSQADVSFHFDADHWMLPAAEDEYRQGIEALRAYALRLGDRDAGRGNVGRFFVRADNLNRYLATVEKRLGGFAQQLSSGVRPTWLTHDPLRDSAIREALMDTGEIQAPTSWLAVDDAFYQARGYTWAMLHTLKGIEMDYRPLLESKNALGQFQRIIYKLEATQYPVLSPAIMNNTGFGIFTNHSLILGSYMSRANAALIDLRLLLAEG